VATRLSEGRQDYRDLRERTKRQEDRREENLKRIVALHRARHLHSFPSQILSDGAGEADVDT
jgi:hypothetical protein